MYPASLVESGKGNLVLVLTRKGGHVGWPEGWLPWTRNWAFMSNAASSFVEAVVRAKMKQKSQQLASRSSSRFAHEIQNNNSNASWSVDPSCPNPPTLTREAAHKIPVSYHLGNLWSRLVGKSWWDRNESFGTAVVSEKKGKNNLNHATCAIHVKSYFYGVAFLATCHSTVANLEFSWAILVYTFDNSIKFMTVDQSKNSSFALSNLRLFAPSILSGTDYSLHRASVCWLPNLVVSGELILLVENYSIVEDCLCPVISSALLLFVSTTVYPRILLWSVFSLLGDQKGPSALGYLKLSIGCQGYVFCNLGE